MQYSDFVHSSTQLMMFSSIEKTSWEHLAIQNALLSINGLMMHHDAITGTHMKKVGEDYIQMMQRQQEHLNG